MTTRFHNNDARTAPDSIRVAACPYRSPDTATGDITSLQMVKKLVASLHGVQPTTYQAGLESPLVVGDDLFRP